LQHLLFMLLVSLASISIARVADAQVVINEVEYDEPSTDTGEYIELKNIGPSPASLADYSMVLVNGSNNTIYRTITFPTFSLAPGQYYVVCGNGANVVNCDLDVTPDADLIQNGAPDAVALLLNGVAVDLLSYEGNVPGYTEGTGAGAESGTTAGESLSRCADGSDTNNNGVDFALRPNTPGASNNCGSTGGPVGACGDPATPIAVIQGSGLASAMIGASVVVEGVVVGDFQGNGLNGFFVQEEDSQTDANPTTSEGIFVFGGATPVAVGNLVRVRGDVAEFSSLTELTGVTDVVVCLGTPVASAQTVAFPVAAVADLERYEGMLVNIAQTLTVTGNYELGRFGSLDLSVGGRLLQPTHVASPGAAAMALQSLNDRSRIVLDDLATGQNPNPIPYKDANNTRRVGDTLASLTGVLDGRLGTYRIQPTQPLSFVSGNPRPPAPASVGGRLRIAFANVLNYFTTLDSGALTCGPAGGLGCRGANSPAEFDRQRTKLLNELQLLDGDIVGFSEIENNPTATLQNLVDGLNARVGAGTYAFINTGSIGTDAIKVALIYKAARVAPVGSFAQLTTATDPRFIDTKNRPALAQTFSEAATGARLTVVVNHLKSKGSACTDVGDPDTADGQGNCNGTRTAAANALVDWLATDPTHSGDADFLLIGDLNAYAKEDPITALKAGGFRALLETFVGDGAYSYQFAGQSGYLDHALASSSLASQITGVTEWHHNADEPVVLDYNTEFKTDDPFNAADPFRSSDHDPIIVGVNLTGAPTAVPSVNAWQRLMMAGALLALGLFLLPRAVRARA